MSAGPRARPRWLVRQALPARLVTPTLVDRATAFGILLPPATHVRGICLAGHGHILTLAVDDKPEDKPLVVRPRRVYQWER